MTAPSVPFPCVILDIFIMHCRWMQCKNHKPQAHQQHWRWQQGSQFVSGVPAAVESGKGRWCWGSSQQRAGPCGPPPVPSGSPAALSAAAQEALHCQLHLPGTRGTLCIVHTGMPCGLQGQGAPGLLASSQVASMLALKEDTLCHCCVLKDGAC